jgi:hypothetical protein
VSFFYELDGKTVSIDAKETSGPQKYQFDAVFPPDRAIRFCRPSRRTPACFGTRIHPARALEVRHRVRCTAARQFRSAVSGRTLCVGRTGASRSRKSTSMRRNRPSRMSSAGLTAPFSPTAKSAAPDTFARASTHHTHTRTCARTTSAPPTDPSDGREWSVQTGSGKTFTMFGPNVSEPEHCGLIPRAINDLFQQVDHHCASGNSMRPSRPRHSRARTRAHRCMPRERWTRQRSSTSRAHSSRSTRRYSSARPVRPAECRCGGGCILHTMCNTYLPVHEISRAASAASGV